MDRGVREVTVHTVSCKELDMTKVTFTKVKDDAVKVLHSIGQHIWKTQQ